MKKAEKQTICMVTTSNLDYDTRILNEINTLVPTYDLKIIAPAYYKKEKNSKFKVILASSKIPKSIPKDIGRVINLFSIIRAIKKIKADIYHAHDLPGLFCTGFAFAFQNKTIVYDSHELWSQVNLFSYWKFLRWPFQVLEKILMRKVTAIITVNDSIKEILEKKYHRPTLSLYNYQFVQRSIKSGLPTNDIIYVGAFKRGRGLLNILKAVPLLKGNFRVLFIGYGRKELLIRQKIKELNLEKKVIMVAPLQPEKLIPIIRKAKIGLCLIENTSLSYYYSSPNKLFQYVAAELPILASDFPEQKKVVLANKIGEVVDPADPIAIARKINEMMRTENQTKYRQNLKNLAEKKFSWQIESKKLLDFYSKLRLNTLDFSLDKYEILLRALRQKFPVVTFSESLVQKPKKFAILRHDVDRLANNALKMAKVEARLGLKASYYFRDYQLKTHRQIIKEVAKLGHEIGYHYESLDQAKGDKTKALEIFKDKLRQFRQIAPVKTIAMHGNPLTKFNNRHLWKKASYSDFEIIGETYLSLARGTYYFSDTGRTWSNRFKIKDIPVRTNHEHHRFKIETTDDLINLVKNADIQKICIVTHPERWNDQLSSWLAYLCLDKIVQIIKKIK